MEEGEEVVAGTAPISLADRILGQDHILRETVTIREWGDEEGEIKLELRGLTVREVAQATAALDRLPRERRLELATPVYVVAGTYYPDEDRKVFSDQHYDALAHEAQKPMEEIASVILRLSGMTTLGLDGAVSAYLAVLDDRDASEEDEALALVALRRIAGREATPTGEARGA